MRNVQVKVEMFGPPMFDRPKPMVEIMDENGFSYLIVTVSEALKLAGDIESAIHKFQEVNDGE